MTDRRHPKPPAGLPVLYEDDAVIAVNKPAGLLAVPIKRSSTPSALTVVAEQLKRKQQRAFVVHRIDRFVSGILLFAKTARDRHALVEQFLEHTPHREYLTVVRGQLERESGTLVHYFRREGFHQELSTPKDRKAARAELSYSVERRFPSASLVRVELVTGLQNQIRAQFAASGHTVIGDRKYRPGEAEERRIERVALHAAHLGFLHPRTQESVAIDCEPPDDFQSLVRQFALTRGAN
jgi:23S rRNA pseudouridine1911/1915/1917 synthase